MTLPYGLAKLEIVGEQQVISMIPGQGMNYELLLSLGCLTGPSLVFIESFHLKVSESLPIWETSLHSLFHHQPYNIDKN